MNSLQGKRDVGLRRRPVQSESPCLGDGHPTRAGRSSREPLKPCSQSASARDRACRFSSGGFTRSGGSRPTAYVRSGARPPTPAHTGPAGQARTRGGAEADDRDSRLSVRTGAHLLRRMNSLQGKRDVGLRRRPVQSESPCLGDGHPTRAGRSSREQLKPCSQSASAQDRAYRFPSGGFTRSGGSRPTEYVRSGARPPTPARTGPGRPCANARRRIIGTRDCPSGPGRTPTRRMNSLQGKRDVGLRRRPVQSESPCLGDGHPTRAGRSSRERLKPCSQSASARDRACRFPSGGFTRSGGSRPTAYVRSGARPPTPAHRDPRRGPHAKARRRMAGIRDCRSGPARTPGE
jgi:hypothetical protein